MSAAPSFREVIRNVNFTRLWLGQIVSSIGDRFYQFALLGVVLGINHGAELGKESARVIFCGILPGLIFAPWMGWAVDHFDRKHVMIFADVVRIVMTLSLLCFWLYLHDLRLVFTAIFLMGAMSNLFIPARQAALPMLVKGNMLVTANALMALIGVIASLFGAIFAGLLVAIFGPKSSFIANVIGLTVSAVLLARIDVSLRPGSNERRLTARDHWQEILAGFHMVRDRAVLRGLIFLTGLYSFVTGMFMVTVLEYAIKSVDPSLVRRFSGMLIAALTPLAPKPPVIEIRVLGLGLLLGCLGIGLGCGVWAAGKSRKWSHRVILPAVALFFLGCGMLLFSKATGFGAVMAGCVLLGFWGAVLAIPIEARLQVEIEDEKRGRVFALKNFVTNAGFLAALGINLDGRLLQHRGAGAMIFDLGLFLVAAAGVAGFILRKKFTTSWSSRSEPTRKA